MSGEAIIHKTTLVPTKSELVDSWLADTYPDLAIDPMAYVGAYRFVDPAGRVGIDHYLTRNGRNQLLHIPLTYRDSRLSVSTELLGTIEHGALGTRYVYEGYNDPVYVAQMIRTIISGDDNAARSDGTVSEITARGTGTEDIGAVTIKKMRRDDQVVTIDGFVDGKPRRFQLTVPRVIEDADHQSLVYEGETVLYGAWEEGATNHNGILARLIELDDDATE